jgi:hypothetical protein
MESQALETGTSLKTVESSATQRGKTTGFSPTRLARMHDSLLRHMEAPDQKEIQMLHATFRRCSAWSA